MSEANRPCRLSASARNPAISALELVSDELNLEVEQPRHPRTLQRARRRRSPRSRQSIAAVVVVLAAIANLLTCGIALVRHSPTLGVLTGIVASVLVVAVTLLSRALSPGHRARPPENERPTTARPNQQPPPLHPDLPRSTP